MSRVYVVTLAIVLVSLAPPASAQMGETPLNRMIMVEELEVGVGADDLPLRWDSASWIGGDWNRVWIKTEGEALLDDTQIEGEVQALFSRLVSPFWEFQVGLRGDLTADSDDADGRGFLVVGFEGLAPFWFEVEPALFVSHEGDISARLAASYDTYVTQRVVAHSSLELNAAAQSVSTFGVGSGVNDLAMGFRIGRQFGRELMPYVGVEWTQSFAETARMRRNADIETSHVDVVAGLRFWF